MYEIEELRETFVSLKDSSVEGVYGVLRIRATEAGPTLGITACTHGNEPSGLAAIRYLVKEADIVRTLQRGTLYLAVNNIRATERFFSTQAAKERRRARFIDINMNRLPKKMPSLVGNGSYEIERARELLSVWRCFDVGFDIHSTTQDIEPMIIIRGKEFFPELFRGFPIKTVLTNIDQVQVGAPAFGFYGRPDRKIPVFEIEAGSHENPKSFERAVECTLALMQNLQMLPGTPKAEIVNHREYFIDGSVLFQNKSYEILNGGFRDFSFLPRGTPIARGALGSRSDIVRAPFDCHVVFCSSSKRPLSLKEEVMFLSRPKRAIRSGRQLGTIF